MINLSSNCSQSIHNRCSVTPLTEFAWWVGRTGRSNHYWHGQKSSHTTGCQCDKDKSCIKLNGEDIYKCNCDSKNHDVEDAGILTSLEELPVQQLFYGNDYYPESWIQYNLGKFQCSGKSKDK